MSISQISWRRVLLSATLIGVCIWCIGAVHQVHSNQNKNLSSQAGLVTQAPPQQDSQAG